MRINCHVPDRRAPNNTAAPSCDHAGAISSSASSVSLVSGAAGNVDKIEIELAIDGRR